MLCSLDLAHRLRLLAAPMDFGSINMPTAPYLALIDRFLNSEFPPTNLF
jgi:hypothetical protein